MGIAKFLCYAPKKEKFFVPIRSKIMIGLGDIPKPPFGGTPPA